MEFRFSANAKEFIPASERRNVYQHPFQPFAGATDARPTQHNQQTHRTVLLSNQGQNVGEWNVAAPEFKPSERFQVRNSGFCGKDKRATKSNDKDNAPESVNPSFRPKSSNWKHTGSSNHRIKNQPIRHEERGGKYFSRPILDKHDDEVQKRSDGYDEETRKVHGTLKEKEIIPSEMGLSSAPKRHRKVKSSRQGTLSQSDVSHSTGHTSGKGSRTSSKDSSSSKGSGASFDEKGNRGPETAMYPTLLGDQSLNSGQNMLPGRSWSTVLQSNPSIGNSASGGNRKDRIHKENKQMQKDEDFVAGSQRQNIFGKGSKKRLQKNTGSQIITKSKDAKPEDIGWTSLDGHPSSIWKNRQKPDAGSNTRQRIYEPYHGDLEWRVDAENARRQMTVSSESRTRNYSGMRAVRNIEGLRRQSTMITEHFRFKNVTKEFSDRAKRILFSGCVKTEKTEDEENYFNNREQSRGWYESYVWNSSAHRHDIVKENRCPCGTGLNPKAPASDSHENQFVCTQKSLQQQNSNKYGSIFDKKVKGSAWSTVSDASQTRHVDVAQAMSGSFQKRLDTFGNEPAISHPTAEILGSNVIHRNGIVGEDSRTALVNASNDEPGQHDIQVENSDFVDEENDWVCVTAKSTIRSRKKERLIASRQKFESGGQSVLDKSKVRSPSDGNIMSRNTDIVKNEIKMKQSRSNNNRTEEDKGKQGELTVVKKEKAKKKRKKKKSKEKEKPLYDNDQQKIREFKMREMIEENLKMNLVELTKTRRSNESEVDKDEVEEWPAIGSKGTHSAKLMSFSDALKRWKPAPERPSSITTQESRGDIEIDMSKLTEEEKIELRRRKLKEKRKQKKIEKKQRTREEKDEHKEPDNQKMPLSFDLGIVFDKLLQSSVEEKSKRKDSKKPGKTVLFSSGVISVASGIAKKNKPDGSRASSTKGKPSGNFLDSTQPLKMSGKERETPRKPKKTLLKKIILRAREAKQKAREAQLGKIPAEKERKDPSSETESVSADEAEAEGETDRVDHSHDGCGGDVSALAMKETGGCPKKDEHSEKDGDKSDNDDITYETDTNEDISLIDTDQDISLIDTEGVDHLCEPLTNLPQEVVSKLHTRKFREYCDHLLSEEINSAVYKILKGLHRFQTRAFLENPIKAKAKRRLVLGIREVAKHTKMGKLRCVIIAPNLEKVDIQGGIDFYLSKIIFNCKQFNVPIVYAMNRQVLGYILSRKVPVSAIGIFSYSGVEDDFQKLCMLVEEQREKYKERVEQIMLDQNQPLRGNVQSYEGRESIKSTVFRINPEAPLFIP